MVGGAAWQTSVKLTARSDHRSKQRASAKVRTIDTVFGGMSGTGCNVSTFRESREATSVHESVSNLCLLLRIVDRTEIIIGPGRNVILLLAVEMANESETLPSGILRLVVGHRIGKQVGHAFPAHAGPRREVLAISAIALVDDARFGLLGFFLL